MIEPVAFLNGRLLLQSLAQLALNDAGFVYGATVTDMCRTIRHRLYRWVDHLARFRQSCKAAYLEVLLDDAEILKSAEELIEHNARLIGANDDLALVLFATPGPVGFYLGQAIAPGEQPTFGMHTFPLPFTRYRPWIEKGVALATPSIRAVFNIDPHIKQRSRMHWWLAEQELRRASPSPPTPLPLGARGEWPQALLLDQAGNVTETASANFLIVKNGVLISPPRERILDGVSLRVVSELCVRLGVAIEYRDIDLAECYAADEALLTCTSYCVAGVRSINGRAISWPGAMLGRLVEAWSSEVNVDIHRQITMP